MTASNDAVLTVSEGDIVHLTDTDAYFHVTEINDPTHPFAHGVVWHGHYWLNNAGHWGRTTVLHIHAGKPAPTILSAQERATCGWGDLP